MSLNTATDGTASIFPYMNKITSINYKAIQNILFKTAFFTASPVYSSDKRIKEKERRKKERRRRGMEEGMESGRRQARK